MERSTKRPLSRSACAGDGLSLDRLLKEIRYREPIEKAVRKKCAESSIAEIAASAYEGDGFDFALCRRMPHTRVAVVSFLLLQKYAEYKTRGVSDPIIFDTFRDVSLRAGLYYEKTGKIGISKEDVIWFRHIMNVNIFKIGVLQFQPLGMIYLDEETLGQPYMSFSQAQKATLPSGTPVINCHIQRNADLTPAKVGRSLREAKTFFRAVFPDRQFRAFLCYSWLLFPKMVENLPKTSNIRQFAHRFRVIGVCNDAKQAKENLFADGKRKAAQKATFLQKMAAEHRECLGFACGIRKI